MGAIIMPANPGFYQNPQTIQELVDFMVARILDHIGIAHTLMPRWGQTHADSD
jgi:4-hydroxy-3-polyprenylbenzoate decarboxylase